MKPSSPILFLLIAFVYTGCRPYANGPVMKAKDIDETFKPVLQFMDYRPGMTFADVGAGSGALTVMMASLMDRSTVYIQDINTKVLKQAEVDKMIRHYSSESGHDLSTKNTFIVTIGDATGTNLPDGKLDLIYSNATVHCFTHLDSMVQDLGKKLKPDGRLFFRDSFKGDHGEGAFCSDKKCGRPLLTIEAFLATMKKNGFSLKKQTPDLSGYPVYGFTFDR